MESVPPTTPAAPPPDSATDPLAKLFNAVAPIKDIEKADKTKEAEPGGEGVARDEPEPAATPPETPDTAKKKEDAEELLVRHTYEAGLAGQKTLSVDAQVWGDKPQMVDQLLQKGACRPSRFETRIFNLSLAVDRDAHDLLLTKSQRPDASFILNRERQWSPEDQTWRVLLEIQHFEFLQTLQQEKKET